MHSPQRGKVKQRGIQPTKPIGLGGGPGDIIYSILSHRYHFQQTKHTRVFTIFLFT